MEYREFRYDHEWMMWEMQNADLLSCMGLYAAVISPDNRLFEFVRTVLLYDPWFFRERGAGFSDDEIEDLWGP